MSEEFKILCLGVEAGKANFYQIYFSLINHLIKDMIKIFYTIFLITCLLILVLVFTFFFSWFLEFSVTLLRIPKGLFLLCFSVFLSRRLKRNVNMYMVFLFYINMLNGSIFMCLND